MNQTRTVRLPVHIIKDLNQCLRVAKSLNKESDTLATPEQVAEYMQRPVEEVRWLMNFRSDSVSMDAAVHDDDDKTVLDTLEDEQNLDPMEAMQQADLSETLVQWLDQLDDRYRQVMVLRFGLEGAEKMTLEKVGEIIGVNRERVRQMQDEAVEWLREAFMGEQGVA